MNSPRHAANVQRRVCSRLGWLAALTLAGGCSDDRGANRPPCPVANGSAVINIRTSVCPEITEFNVVPMAPLAGSAVELNVTVVDPDSSNLSFVWTATSGTIADPGVAVTTYRCTAPGPATIAFTVSDGNCDDRSSGDVVCP